MAVLTGSGYSEAIGGDIWGYAENDYIDASWGDDVVYGYGGDDTLLGYYGSDYLFGGTGSDALYGEANSDYLDGYGYSYYEYDTLVGGTGADVFAIADSTGYTQYTADGYWSTGYADGYATISDYSYLEGDVIQLGSGDYWNYSSSIVDYNGNGWADTAIYYGYNLIGVVSDATTITYSYV